MELLELEFVVAAEPYRRALRRYLWGKTLGFVIGAGVALILAAAVARSEPWLSGFVAGVAIAFLFHLLRIFRSASAAAAAREASSVAMRISEEHLEFDSAMGVRRIPWERVRGVHPRGEFVELDLGRDESPVWVPAAVVAGAPLAALEARSKGASPRG